jgi:hypothetical protein
MEGFSKSTGPVFYPGVDIMGVPTDVYSKDQFLDTNNFREVMHDSMYNTINVARENQYVGLVSSQPNVVTGREYIPLNLNGFNTGDQKVADNLILQTHKAPYSVFPF